MNVADIQNYDLFNPTPEHRMLREQVRAFVQKEIESGALDRDRREFFDRTLFKKFGNLGLLGITVPETYGGSEMDPLAAVIAHEEIAASDPGLCLAYLAHAMLCANNIAVNASEEQKQRALPKLCSGEWIGAMAMSEPQAGTDVMAMATTASKTSEGFVLNGRKMWITNGAVDDQKTPADCVFVYAKTDEVQGKAQLSSFLVERDFRGFFVGQKIGDKTGMRASLTAELVFEDCLVPNSHLVGVPGDSLRHMMRNLEIERITLAAISLGIARRCLEIMIRHANERQAFGQPLAKFGQIQEYVSKSYAEYKACRTYCYDTARRMKLKGEKGRMDSDGVKLVCAPMAKRVADRAMQVLGGYGYVGEYVVERLWRDAKLLEIGGGTLEAHQKNIASDLARDPARLFQ